jgi:hypothetical protein
MVNPLSFVHPCWLVSDSCNCVFPARDNEFDVVLIDTAGRMQDNEVRISGNLAAPECS